MKKSAIILQMHQCCFFGKYTKSYCNHFFGVVSSIHHRRILKRINFYPIVFIVLAAMPSTKSTKRGSGGGSNSRGGKQLSARTKKQIDSLPEHAQHIYKKAHSNALEQYQNPKKRRGGKKQSAEEVSHKVAWAAVKKEYKKKGNEWIKKEED